MVLLIDNFDSFTWNLVHYLQVLGADVDVVRNDVLDTLSDVHGYSHIVVSPGPGRPEDISAVGKFLRMNEHLPVLGVCLGHQLLATLTGASVGQARVIRHGKVSELQHNGSGLFKDVPQRISVCRYHSLSVDANSLAAEEWRVVATSVDDNEIMAIEHVSLPWVGIQFHPEAILTEYGHLMLENFLKVTCT